MTFDPYREWLGLSGGKPHAFSLLGVSHGETDVNLIREAAVQRLNHLRSIRPGQHMDAWQQVMAEIEAARDLLVDPQRRAEYLAQLKQRSERRGSSTGERTAVPSQRDAAPASRTSASVATSAPVASAAVAQAAPARQASQPSAAEENLDPFDPMAPLPLTPVARPMSPSTPAPSPSVAAPAGSGPAFGGSAFLPVESAEIGGSAPGSIAAKHRDYLKRRRMIRTGIAASIFVLLAILAGVGYAKRDALSVALGLKETTGGTPTNSDPNATQSNPSASSGDSSNSDSSTIGSETNNSSNDSNSASNSPNDSSTGSSDSSDSGTWPEEGMGDGESNPDAPTRPSDLETPGSDPSMDESGDDPAMEDESLDDDSEQMPDDEAELRELTRPEAYAVSKAAGEVLTALRAGDQAVVDDRMSYLRLMAEGSEVAAWIDHLQAVVDTNREYWEVVAECVGQLQSEEELAVTSTLFVKVIEASSERLVYRVEGAREERAPRQLPPGLARFIVEHIRKDNDDNKRLIGALYAAESANDSSLRDRAEAAWREAETSEIDVAPLLDWLNDDFAGLATAHAPAETPDEAEIAAAREQAQTDYAGVIDEARTPDQRVSAGEMIFADATTWEATPEAYARFALAAELTAGSGQSTKLKPLLQVWETWFKLDRATIQADLLTRCARMNASPEECANTVEMALAAAQQAAGKKQIEQAEKLLEAALDAAQKSRNTELRASTQQQARTLRARMKEDN